MLKNQFVLTTAEKRDVTEISLFVNLMYFCYWNKATVTERAPLWTMLILLNWSKSNLIKRSVTLPEKYSIINTGINSENLVWLSLFGLRVSVESETVKGLQRRSIEKPWKMLDGTTFNHRNPLQSFLTPNTMVCQRWSIKDSFTFSKFSLRLANRYS